MSAQLHIEGNVMKAKRILLIIMTIGGNAMKYLVSTIGTLVIVPMVLCAAAGKTTTDSIETFSMRIDKKVCLLVGGIGTAFSAFCLYGSTVAGQTGFTTVIFGILLAIGVFVLLVPTKGFYENEVKNNTLYARRFYAIHKSLSISEIDHCVLHANQYGGEIRVYQKGRKNAFCWIDLMQNNTENFLDRMDKEGIPVADAPTKEKRWLVDSSTRR